MTEPVKPVDWVEPPWTVDVIGGDVCILGTPSEKDTDPPVIAIIPAAYYSRDVALAHAELLAKAPELLRQLRWLAGVYQFSSVPHQYRDDHDEFRRCIKLEQTRGPDFCMPPRELPKSDPGN